MIVSQVSELLFSHELFLLCLGERELQASASEWEHEKEDGLVLGEWEDERLGISPGARGKLGEGGGGGAGQVSAEDPGLRIPVLEPSEAALLASERRVVGTNAWPSSLWGGEELCDCPSF